MHYDWKKKVLPFPAGGVNIKSRETWYIIKLPDNRKSKIEPRTSSFLRFEVMTEEKRMEGQFHIIDRFISSLKHLFSTLYNLKSFLILTLAVEYTIFSMERTKYLKKDMS